MSELVKDHHGLTAKQKAFADAWANAKMAGADFANWQIAEAAGYAGDKDALAVNASRTLAHPKVRDYLHQRAKDYLREGAVEVAITLRTLSQKADSERVRADTAARLAAGLGLIDADQGVRGPAVLVQFAFPAGIGAGLAQYVDSAPNTQTNQQVAQVDHALGEGEVGAKGSARRSKRAPPPGQAQAAEAPPRVKNRARPPAAGRSASRAPQKSPGKNSGGSDG